MKFVIEGRLPGLNEIIQTARYNRYAGASQKKKETDRCKWAIIAGSVPHFRNPVEVSFTWFEKCLRRDPDNISGGGTKFILDALVELGRIPNDTRRWIKGINHSFPEPDKENPRVEVSIKEILEGDLSK